MTILETISDITSLGEALIADEKERAIYQGSPFWDTWITGRNRES